MECELMIIYNERKLLNLKKYIGIINNIKLTILY